MKEKFTHKGHSTEHANLDIVNAIHSNMDAGKSSCGVFADLKKAFDTVDHGNLLKKLAHYGLNKFLIHQKRALRFICFADRCDHAIPLFLRANILPIHFSVVL